MKFLNFLKEYAILFIGIILLAVLFLLPDETSNTVEVIGIADETTTEAAREPQTRLPAERVTEPAEEIVGTDAKLAAEVCANYYASCVEAAVIEDGAVTKLYTYGYKDNAKTVKADEDVKFRCASLSKLVTDMIFMCLVDEGLVSETGDIGDYLGFPVRNPSFPDVVITPEMLMCHTSSIVDGGGFLTGSDYLSAMPVDQLLNYGRPFLLVKPGTMYSYSNLSVALIGCICETVTGKKLNELADTYLFKKLGIDAAFLGTELDEPEKLGDLTGLPAANQMGIYEQSAVGQTHHLAQGNLCISAKDYAEILTVLLRKGVANNGERILSEESVEKISAQHFDQDKYGVGYGVQLEDTVVGNKKMRVHTGSAYGMFSCFAYDPESGDGVVVLSNGAVYNMDPETEIYEVCLYLIRLLFPT